MLMMLPRKKSIFFVLAMVLVLFCCGLAVYYSLNFIAKAEEKEIVPVNNSRTEPIQIAASPDFFVEYRLEREKMRSEKSDVLREIIKNSKTEEARSRAQDSVLKLMQDKQKELEMENLIKSRGFHDALVFIREESVSAVVKSGSLSREEVLQVADIIHKVVGIKAEDITISAKP